MKGGDYQNLFFLNVLELFSKVIGGVCSNTDTFKTWKSGQSDINQYSTLPDNAAYKE